MGLGALVGDCAAPPERVSAAGLGCLVAPCSQSSISRAKATTAPSQAGLEIAPNSGISLGQQPPEPLQMCGGSD